MDALVAAGCAALGISLLLPGPARLTPVGQQARLDRVADDRAVLHRLRPLLALLAFVGAWTFLGSGIGVVAGLVAGAVAWRVLGKAESPAVRRRREELERDLPTAVHLLAACLEAGGAMVPALETVAAALPGAVADELLLVRHRLAVGMDPVVVWGQLAAHDQLGVLGRAMARAHDSGASVAVAVHRLGDDLAVESRSRTDRLARSVEVRAAAPLGVCFLPAFLLVGVVPLVVGVFTSMRLFG